ncbi:unnamed protein product, partial [Rotaria socialis]
MGRSRPITFIDYSQQFAMNLDDLDKRERININEIITHEYLKQILRQYESFGLQADTVIFCILTSMGAISHRSFIRRLDNIPV